MFTAVEVVGDSTDNNNNNRRSSAFHNKVPREEECKVVDSIQGLDLSTDDVTCTYTSTTFFLFTADFPSERTAK